MLDYSKLAFSGRYNIKYFQYHMVFQKKKITDSIADLENRVQISKIICKINLK